MVCCAAVSVGTEFFTGDPSKEEACSGGAVSGLFFVPAHPAV